MKKIALVTGATSGIGKATSMILAENNYNIIITGRRKDRLEYIAGSIQSKSGAEVIALHYDVRNKEEVDSAIDSLPDRWKKINVLVNNAGLAAGLDPINEGSIDDWERMIDTNIKGLLYMTKKVIPLIIEAGDGHIVNIGSTAGKEVYEKGNVYCGTKHAVDAISKGMRIDLLKHKIKVTNVNPGMVETEFSIVRFAGDEEKADKVYQGMTPLYAEDVADAILFTITRPPHVCINDMILTATAQANSFYKITE